ncbi:Uncharacterised protein [Mycobacteroides abscessus subsp. abscessus]|nr:Uncharacterised protein [Mycobacteroides abscessus subsp. abscessus]
MTKVEPGASRASCSSVAILAARLRYMVTPVEATRAGRPGSKPAARNRSHHESTSKSTGTRRSRSGIP